MKKNFAEILFMISVVISFEACQTESKKELSFAKSDSLESGATLLSISEIEFWKKYNYDEREGKRLFEHYCSVCHGTAGAGDGFNSYNLEPKPKSFRDSLYMSNLSDSNLLQVISLGGTSMNKSVMMPAYSHTLSIIERERIVKYIRTLTNKEN